MAHRTALLGTLFGMLLGAPAGAHHSQAAFFSDQFGELEGEITAVFWRNPHVGFMLKRIAENGEEEVWELETNSVNMLNRLGFTSPVTRAGERVKVAGLLSRHGLKAMRVTNMLLPDGREAVLMPTLVDGPRWADTRPLPADTPAAAAAGGREPHGIFRIWTSGMRPGAGRAAPEELLTASARAARQAWDPLTQDPALSCTPPGMPAMMSNPFPIEFVDEGERILLRLEEWDGVRTIHMSEAAARDQAPSPAGRSIGRWEGDTLVVTTDRVSWPYFDDFGTPQTSAVEIVERFTLTNDATRLDYHAVITDPATFTAPISMESYWHWVPGETIKPYECAVWQEGR